MRAIIIVLAILGAAVLVAVNTLTLFVIQPIGAIPDGVTVVMVQIGKLRFIDSPDAICEREMEGVSLLCRGMVAAKVAKEATILLRLPYMDFLYLHSTEGATYER